MDDRGNSEREATIGKTANLVVLQALEKELIRGSGQGLSEIRKSLKNLAPLRLQQLALAAPELLPHEVGYALYPTFGITPGLTWPVSLEKLFSYATIAVAMKQYGQLCGLPTVAKRRRKELASRHS